MSRKITMSQAGHSPRIAPSPEQSGWLAAMDDFRTTAAARLHAAEALAASLPKHPFAPDLEAVCEIDLHCHSFCSDGYFSPTMKVFEACRRGMKGLAIADHDVFDGQREAIRAGMIFGVDVVPAAEFYTDRPGIEIIAHFPDAAAFLAQLDRGAFAPVVEPIRNAKKQQLAAMVDRVPACFAQFGFAAEITARDIDRHVRNGISTKGDISVILWQKYGPALAAAGLATDVKDVQARYTTRDDMLNVPLHLDLDLSPAAFVRRIRDWGGLPGLPHPTELRKKEGLDNAALESVIANLAEAGLQTLEVDGWRNATCPETGLPQTDVFEAMRRTWNNAHPEAPPLLFTNGSDDHNQPGEGLQLGCGRNRNLRPEFGRADNLACLRERQAWLTTTKA
jgi:hypothetical protein